jgi:hypothetical protein
MQGNCSQVVHDLNVWWYVTLGNQPSKFTSLIHYSLFSAIKLDDRKGKLKDDIHEPQNCRNQGIGSHGMHDGYVVVCYTSVSTIKYIKL